MNPPYVSFVSELNSPTILESDFSLAACIETAIFKSSTITSGRASLATSSYDQAIRELKEEGLLNDGYLIEKLNINNFIKADHGKLKRLIKPTLGFKTMKTAFATIEGFEIMRMFLKTNSLYAQAIKD